LQKNFEELKHQNDELKMNNEKNMRRLQGIIAFLHELMPDIHISHMGQQRARGEHRRSQDNPSRTAQRGIRILTPRPNNQVPEMANPRRDYDRRVGKAPMYEETTKNIPLRALCVPPSSRDEAK